MQTQVDINCEGPDLKGSLLVAESSVSYSIFTETIAHDYYCCGQVQCFISETNFALVAYDDDSGAIAISSLGEAVKSNPLELFKRNQSYLLVFQESYLDYCDT